ncbi:MAG: hypothetical protein ACYC0X_33725 [Pirellulaceae bacterium]
MLIPRFTLRRLLLLMTASGVFFLIVAQAVDGHAWAIGVSLAGASLLLSFLVYGILFVLAYLLATILGWIRSPVAVSTPFATLEPPPQIIPPEDPE